MDVLVAGGTGFIGRALCGELADRGYTVTAASYAPDASLPAPGVEKRRHVGECYELGGPHPLTLAETVRVVRPNTLVVPLPIGLSAVCFTAAEFLPGVPLGRDQYRIQRLDNTPDHNDVTAFGVEERQLTSLHEYLDAHNPRRPYPPARAR